MARAMDPKLRQALNIIHAAQRQKARFNTKIGKLISGGNRGKLSKRRSKQTKAIPAKSEQIVQEIGRGTGEA